MYLYKVSFSITPSSIEKVEEELNIKFNENGIYTCDDYEINFSTDFWYNECFPEDEPDGLGTFSYNSIDKQYIYDIITKIRIALNQEINNIGKYK
jgi:hypothetical protein